jgi:hypothetical protein
VIFGNDVEEFHDEIFRAGMVSHAIREIGSAGAALCSEQRNVQSCPNGQNCRVSPQNMGDTQPFAPSIAWLDEVNCPMEILPCTRS